MLELDKRAIGARIREIRRSSGLRQWELAKILGTTQSAIHKYEHGVVPEPRRLMLLARVGTTTIEWILTGRHAEGGDEGRERPTPDVLRTASRLQGLDERERERVDEALRILRDAAGALTTGEPPGSRNVSPGAPAPLPRETLRLLEAAERIAAAVAAGLLRDASDRLDERESVREESEGR